MNSDFVVVLTPGRSSSSTYYHLKWAAELPGNVFVFAGCRTQESEEKFHTTASQNSLNLAQYKSWSGETDNVVNSMLQEIEDNPGISSTTQIVILFAGGKQSIYVQLYQQLTKKNTYQIRTVNESEINSTVQFTLDDWMVSNSNEKIKLDSEKNKLHIKGDEEEIVLWDVETGLFENPTRLYAQYREEFTITQEMDILAVRESLKDFRKIFRKKIEILNLILIENELTTEVRIKPQIFVHLPFECVEIYYDENFLTRSLFLYLVMDKEPIIKLHNADFEIERRFTILRNKLISSKRRKKANHVLEKIVLTKRYLSDLVNLNLSRTDSMKWLIRDKGNLELKYTKQTLVTDGFNGRELSTFINSSNFQNCDFKEGNDLVRFGDFNTWVSAFVVSLNAHHYLSLKSEHFNQSIERFNRSLRQKSEDFDGHLKITIVGIELRRTGVPYYIFKLDDEENSLSCPTNDFCELMFALAKNTQKHEQMFENLWSIEESEKTIRPYNDLLQIHGISIKNKDHVIDADGYGLLRLGKKLCFEISDVHSTSEYNSERVLDKYEKYEKMASNFPYPVYNTVFSVFNRPTEDDLEKEKNRIIPFIEQGKNRIWKFLDLSQITPGSDLQVEIPLISLGKFLFDIDSEHANIYNFEEWCFMTNNNTLSFRVSSEEE